MPDIGVAGGDRLDRALAEIARRIGSDPHVNVGFLENATYPDGTSVAYIAAIQEFGGTWPMPARTQTIYRKVLKNGNFARDGRFVKRKDSNFATEHEVEAHTITIPARPFFRRMIAAKKAEWGPATAKALKAKDYDSLAALEVVGTAVAGQLQQSIRDLTDPPLAQSTIAKKKFSKPLIDSGDMLRAVDHEVIA
jgi:hypothetical protein